MIRFAAMLVPLLLGNAALAAGQAPPPKRIARKPLPAQRAQEPRQEDPTSEDPDERPVRDLRPVTVSASLLEKTPVFGATLTVDLLPYVGLGIGYGYFSIDNISGSFIPVTLHGYVLTSNFSPYVEVGADFVTVKFDGTTSLLNSTFHGTQLIAGAGLEYRFDFGLNLRVSAVRFINAKIWSPGLELGYSIQVF